jgi:hypothetical protein
MSTLTHLILTALCTPKSKCTGVNVGKCKLHVQISSKIQQWRNEYRRNEKNWDLSPLLSYLNYTRPITLVISCFHSYTRSFVRLWMEGDINCTMFQYIRQGRGPQLNTHDEMYIYWNVWVSIIRVKRLTTYMKRYKDDGENKWRQVFEVSME